jgi:hypothetical protein
VASEADHGVLWGDCSVAGDEFGVPLLESIPERPPLPLLWFSSAVWSRSSVGWATTGAPPDDVSSFLEYDLGLGKGPNWCFGFAFGVEGEEMPPEVALVMSRLVNNAGTLARGVSLLSISSPSNVLSVCPL